MCSYLCVVSYVIVSVDNSDDINLSSPLVMMSSL